MAEKKELSEVGEQIAKKRKPRGGNSPVIGDNGLMLEPGDNQKYIALSLKLMHLPSIDLHNPEQVQARLDEYFKIQFEADAKPTVAGMAMALGICRQDLWAIRTGGTRNGRGTVWELPRQVSDSIKKAYIFMENLWESYMQNGKINPVSGIFLGKNNYGYQDKTEYVVTPNVQNDSDYDPEDIKKRYLPDSTDSNDS